MAGQNKEIAVGEPRGTNNKNKMANVSDRETVALSDGVIVSS